MINADKLVKFYDTFQALKGVSFEVKPGEILGFLGPNGAGKTTCMKILTGYMPPTSGSATINGLSLDDDSLQIRQIMGYLPESTPLYGDMMVYDYLGYVANMRDVPAEKVHKKIITVAKTCDLKAFIKKDISQLSKGQRQRVGLAQAMIHDPQYMILDEPTSGLDPNQIVEIRELIKTLGKERTIILSTHNLPEVQATCNRVLIINEGEIVAHGGRDELLAEQGVPRISVKIGSANGALEKKQVRETLKSYAGFSRVVDASDEGAQIFAFEVEGQKDGGDLRRTMFEFAVEQKWVLLEMRKHELNLENIFRKLTSN